MAKRSTVHHVLNTVRKQVKLTERELWLAYRDRGGMASQNDLSSFLRGAQPLGSEEIGTLATALNEAFIGESDL